MSDRTPAVTGFLRNDGEILLLKRSDDATMYPGRWAAVSGYLESADPVEHATREITEETGIPTLSLVRTGRPLPVDHTDTRWLVHPFLFDTPTRTVSLNHENLEFEWIAPTAIRRRHTVPKLWDAYQRVAPTPETIATDTEHGSAYISIRALEVLRDTAATAVNSPDAIDTVRATAHRLLDARPSMTAVRTRINRVMVGATDPDTIERAAIDTIQAALGADSHAGENAARFITDQTVLTLSRSGTVRTALESAAPSVIVAESRPANEGTEVAEELADIGLDVTVCTDAAIAHVLSSASVDAVLVGADTILPDGTVVNKIGTRGAALAASYESVPVYVITARDKITPDFEPHLEDGPPSAIYGGSAPLTPVNPSFDRTPPELIDTIITESDRHNTDEIKSIASEHAAYESWQKSQQ